MDNESTTNPRRRRRGVVLLSVATLALPGTLLRQPHEARLAVLVRAASSAEAARAVRSVDGKVTSELEIVEGVVAAVPRDEIAALDARPGVEVTRDDGGTLESVLPGTTYDTETQAGSMYTTARLVGAETAWAQGYTGTGVAIAIVDSGVQANSTYFGTRLVAGADYSGSNNALTDGFGHGTHLAGIIAGQQGTIGAPASFTGIAPSAKLYSVKVADNAGATSLTKILQGLDWVYKNRLTTRIRVVNLSFGVAAYDDYRSDPLAAAVERLWANKIVVVTSTGNLGPNRGLVSPAYDPTVLAVGALDTKGTVDPADDAPATFSAGARDAASRQPDLLAPGRSIQSLRATGSALDTLTKALPGSQVGTAFMKGSGTSQATAVISGLVALYLQFQPQQTADDVKANLVNYATQPGPWDQLVQGHGRARIVTETPVYTGWGTQGFAPATVSATTADATADNQARAASWQGSQWLGSQWLGSQWLGSFWMGSLWMGSVG